MAATLKISEGFYEDTFTLVAIHSSLEDFKLAYGLNHNLKSHFKRCRADLDFSQKVSFPIFEWKDMETDGYWTLITNRSFTKERQVKENLFQNEPSFTIHYLLPEFKEVDFFLKIEQDALGNEKEILEKIVEMPGVVTAYSLRTQTIKSINNLIY